MRDSDEKNLKGRYSLHLINFQAFINLVGGFRFFDCRLYGGK